MSEGGPGAFGDDDVARLARLARLRLSEDERRSMGAELARIKAHVDALADVDVEGVQPMVRPFEDLDAPARADVVGAVAGRDALRGSAGYDDDTGLVRVPKVIE